MLHVEYFRLVIKDNKMSKEFKKIHIIGSAGSGKTYTSMRLSERLNIKPFELDNLFWDKMDKTYSRKTSPIIRDEELHKVLNYDSWILEGVYYDWVSEGFQKADLIIFLRPSFLVCTFRMIVRFMKERTGIIHHEKRETISGLIKTIKRNRRYHEVYTFEIIRLLTPYKNKVKFFDKADHAIHFIQTRNN